MVATETVALIALAVVRIDEIMASHGRRPAPANASGPKRTFVSAAGWSAIGIDLACIRSSANSRLALVRQTFEVCRIRRTIGIARTLINPCSIHLGALVIGIALAVLGIDGTVGIADA